MVNIFLIPLLYRCLGPIEQCLAYLSSIGFALKFIGLKSFEFGSCVITSIGGIGIEDSFAPIPALTFAPMLLTICKKTTKLVFDEDGKVNQKKFMKFNFTSDFRFFELKAASQIIEEIHRIGENPVVFEEECEKYLKKVQDKKSN